MNPLEGDKKYLPGGSPANRKGPQPGHLSPWQEGKGKPMDLHGQTPGSPARRIG